MRTAAHPAAIAAAGLLAAAPLHAPLHAQLRAHAGVVAGNAQFGPQFQCATSGPTIGWPWYAGLSLPTEGIAACGLSGVLDDRTGAAGPLTAAASASGPMASTGTFTGTAGARAEYWKLGVSAGATATGDAAPGTYRQAAAYASFAEELTYTSPSVAHGTPGHTDFTFLVEGMLRSLPVAPYGTHGSVALAVFANGRLWGAFSGTATNDAVPYVYGGSTGLPGGFVLGPGALAGAAAVTTTGDFAFVWGVPLRVEIALATSVAPCCFGASLVSDFYNSAVLTGVEAHAPGGRVRDFVVHTSSGLRLDAGGVVGPAPTTVPEPGPVWSMASGLVALGWWVRRGAGRARKGSAAV